MRDANVYYKNVFAGIISETDEGFLFTYATSYLESPNPKPISLTLPLQKEAYFNKILFPFFDGLIPEGWLLNIAITNWKINQKDRFGLLITLCKDTIGCISIIKNN